MAGQSRRTPDLTQDDVASNGLRQCSRVHPERRRDQSRSGGAYHSSMIEPSDSVATVVFTCSATELVSLDINVGPCVSHQPGKRPLVSPAHQSFGDELRQVAGLYSLLGGR